MAFTLKISVFCDFLKNGSNVFFSIDVIIKCHKLLVNFNPIEIKEEDVN